MGKLGKKILAGLKIAITDIESGVAKIATVARNLAPGDDGVVHHWSGYSLTPYDVQAMADGTPPERIGPPGAYRAERAGDYGIPANCIIEIGEGPLGRSGVSPSGSMRSGFKREFLGESE